ncbi:hypothetical protein EVAR_48954_1 [Eumeta japonica]|uniref:Uncharacterized protein n=1 Tax=Eumeta variegata TaxID=151549 RepID=A0A4C1Y4W8_EUMVA|nr:hypothetical protein EVAR_48954_1 [Eumeta japonica]
MLIRDLNKLRVVTKICRPVRGAARSAHGACSAAYAQGMVARGRRARPRRLVPEVYAVVVLALAGDMTILVSWRPVPLRHAEACAAGRCRESTRRPCITCTTSARDTDLRPYRKDGRFQGLPLVLPTKAQFRMQLTRTLHLHRYV